MKKTILNAVIASLFSAPFAANAALNFSKAPAGSASKEPAPNVIVSVDNSGSMGEDGMTALKSALKSTFDSSFIEDGRIRLAYQSMWGCKNNEGVPSFDPKKDSSCGGFVPMAELAGSSTGNDGSHRSKFFTWIDGLKHGNNTPSHLMMFNAGEYLKTTGVNSPWNAVPGKADNKPLACRRSYHILMTDGGWNYFNDMPMLNGSTSSSLVEVYDKHTDNADGTKKILPDGTEYDPTSPETRVYADAWGRQTVDGGYNYWKGNDGKVYGSLSSCSDKTRNCKPTSSNFDWRDVVPTLADMAFHYWSTDLQPGLASADPEKNVSPLIKKSGPETFTADKKSQTLSEYWNPRNNPATWRHMTTYTIGFKGAATWPRISTDPLFSTNTFDGDFSRLVVGNRKWTNPIQPNLHANRIPYRNGYTWINVPSGAERYPETFKVGSKNYYADIEEVRQQELWHIALNSRGQFYPAKTDADLKKAFGDILRSIIDDNSKPVSGYASSSSSVVGSETALFRSGYAAKGWSGYVEAVSLEKGTGSGSASRWGEDETTATKLDALEKTASARNVYTTNAYSGSSVPFAWESLAKEQQDSFRKTGETGETGDTAAKNRLAFIRGDRTLEGSTFRARNSRHGDIVNSAIWYNPAPSAGLTLPGYADFASSTKKRPPMLYVGANDGMLHAFNAENGEEKFAFIPLGVYPNLNNLTDHGYSHEYFVDGSPFTGDVPVGSRWATYLAGTLGAGGKGYFLLDVTDPDTTANKVVLDNTATSDPDIGHIFGQPVVAELNATRSLQFARMNNGRWALIMGNGYNSTNERPVLLIQYLTGSDKSIKKITASSAGSESKNNGLSSPLPVDINADGIVDIVYAGDIRGNMWKFDLTAKNDANWNVAFSAKPLFTASKGGSRQPITAAPAVRANKSVGGLMVAFGSGQNLTDGDRTDRESGQTFYSMLDNTKYVMDKGAIKIAPESTHTTVDSVDLVERTFNSSPVHKNGDNEMYWKMDKTQTTLLYEEKDGVAAKRGWYWDFPAGQRVIEAPSFYNGTDILHVLHESPASGGNSAEESCSPPVLAERKYETFIGVEFGLSPKFQVLDVNNDGLFNGDDGNASSKIRDPGKLIKVPGGARRITGDETCETLNNCPAEYGAPPTPPLTINWRQLR